MNSRKHAITTKRTVLSVAALALTVALPIYAQTDLASAVSSLQFREIGPAVMGGRIADFGGS